MSLNNNVYDLLKWIVMIVIPAFIVLWEAIGNIWGWSCVHEVSVTLTAIEAFLGALIGVSSASYNKSEEQTSNDLK